MNMVKHSMLILAFFILALVFIATLGPGIAMAEVAANQELQTVNTTDHDEHGKAKRDKGDGEHEEVVRLHADEIKEFAIEVLTANPGQLQVHVKLSGEVAINPDKLAHIVPRVSGVAQAVYKQLGDQVKAGEVLAMLESRELSEVKSAYLVGKERMALAAATFTREQRLWQAAISSEREFLDAQNNLAEARIEMRAAEQKLHALGFSESYIEQLSFSVDEQFTRYEMVAPFAGTIVAKHISLGEMLKDDAEAFIVADLSTVWVDFTVYQSDLPFVDKGMEVRVSAGANRPTATAKISYVSPIIDAATRTASARVVLANRNGTWRPGTFVAGNVAVDKIAVEVVIPKTALQTVDGRTVVFVAMDEGFKPHPVVLGRANQTHIEIISGLIPGQRYVARGSFVLKAQLAKGAFGDGHNH